VTINTKRFGQYLQSLAMTAVVTGLLPVILMAVLWLVFSGLQELASPPLANLGHQAGDQLVQVLTILGNGDPWQGLVTMGATSSLVGMLFDTYAFCSVQGMTSR
jgi:hypothetical protein